ncbi:hypothetical protein OC845_002751 [Tilletia horrida]|nr:hypothetical protein OC845_002751 [Tilletia horrida]
MAGGSKASSSSAASASASNEAGSGTPTPAAAVAAAAADQAAPARNRSAKACINCSVKKRRCDGGQPECSVCAGLGITCSYNNNPLRRGPPKGFRSDPETSAKAKLVRKLETTIRDLVAQMGKESAAREIYRISMERGINEVDMDYAKAEVGPTHHEGSDAEMGRSPKRLRTEGHAPSRLQTGAASGAHGYPPRGYETDQDSNSGTPHSQYAQLPAHTATPYGYPAPQGARPGPGGYPGQPHPHPQLAHLAHEASMFRRAPASGQYRNQPAGYPPIKSQEDDDDFLGVNERGDLMHRGSSSGIGLLNRTHTQIQHHGAAPSPLNPNLPHVVGASPDSDRAAGSPGARVYLPPISTIQGGSHLAGPSPLGMAGTVPLPLATSLPPHPSLMPNPPPPGMPTNYPYHQPGMYHPGQAMPSQPQGSAYQHHHINLHTPASALLQSQSARSSPAPYDEQRGRAAHAASSAHGIMRPASTDPIERGRSQDGYRNQHKSDDRDSSQISLTDQRPFRRLKDEHRMESISPARSASNARSGSPGRIRRGSGSSDLDMDESRDDEQRPGPALAVGAYTGKESLPRVSLTPEQKRLLFKYYYSDFHPFWPVLFKPALDAIPIDELPDRLDEVLLYAIWTMSSAVMPTSSSDIPSDATKDDASRSNAQEQEAETVAHLRSMAPTFYACAEAHLFAARLRPTVSTIQSLFLLSLYSHGCGELSRAWVYSGLACAMLMDLGLHRWPIHRIELLHESAERETRTRLIWCVYILDKVLSAEMGRPVILRATDCDAPFLSEVEADELEPWTGSLPKVEGVDSGETTQFIHAPSCLNWGIRLFQIVEKILSSVHAFRRKAQLRHNANAHHILVEIDKELNRWKAALPDWLSFERLENTRKAGEARDREEAGKEEVQVSRSGDDEEGKATRDQVERRPSRAGSGRSRPLPSFFALHLWYFTSILLLHRPFIPQDEGALLSEVLASESHKKCTEAADAICDMVERSNTPVDRLSTDLAYCIFTAAVLQLFNARLADEDIAKAAKRRLNLCRQWLKELSETWPAASAHKQLLDGFSIVGAGAIEDVEIQLGIEAAAVAVAADAEAEAKAKEGGTDGVATAASAEPISMATNASSTTASSQVAVGTSPSLLAMPGSGRLSILNGSGTSPNFNIPVPSVTRSPFFSMNAGRPFPSLQAGTFMLDGGGSALGTAQGPVTPQQRAQLEQYQAYMASFQSRYAMNNPVTGTGIGNFGLGASATELGGPGSSNLGMNGFGAGVGGIPSSSVGTWVVPNTVLASLNTSQPGTNGVVGAQGSNPAPEIMPTAPTNNAEPALNISNEIMTPMRMVNASVQAQQNQSQLGAAGSQTNSEAQTGQGIDGGASVSMTMGMPLISADAPVGLWDIENFFWNERSAGATSTAASNPHGADIGLPAPQAGLNANVPGPSSVVLGNANQMQGPFIEPTARSTPSSVFGIPPPPTGGPSSSNNADTGNSTSPNLASTTYGANTGMGGPAASFSQLYSQVHARKASNNGQGGTSVDFVPVGEMKAGGQGVAGGVPTDGLSMLAEVTAAGAQQANPADSESSSMNIAASGNGAQGQRGSSGSASFGTPMLGVQPGRRMTPLLGTGNGSGTPSGSFSTGTPSFGISTGGTPLFNLGIGLGPTSSSSGSSGGNTNNLLAGASGGSGASNSIISLSPFGFSMTPDPVVWDALALLELPPSFAKV